MSKETSNSDMPLFSEVQSAISSLQLEYTPSALHGLICGFLCAPKKIDEKESLKKLFKLGKQNPNPESIAVIARLYNESKNQLDTMNFDFHPLLPSDATSLIKRSKCLSDWCSGFNKGFLEAGILIEEIKQEESRDALLHIIEIAELDYDNVSVEEEDEKAYMEIYEYVRMAILMIHSELHLKSFICENSNKTLH